jgi:HD superfamily phosphohydrolase
MPNKRYIVDPLYGNIFLPDYLWKILQSPELQRLREIRLCNINSLCLTGGANINRYEHAIGTCHLAIECSREWFFNTNFSQKDLIKFYIAALVHDIANSAFGHSIEYIEKKEGFNPEEAFVKLIFGDKSGYTYHNLEFEPVFFGLQKRLPKILIDDLKLSDNDIKDIGDFISGKGKFGKLISNRIDLDNIDNVFRLAYHIGIKFNHTTPMLLAKSLFINNLGQLTLKDNSVSLVLEWLQIRKKLYDLLLLNKDEFSGKAMLTEAIEKSKIENLKPFHWYDTDWRILEKLSYISAENKQIISRLITGDLYGCLGVFSSTDLNILYKINDFNLKKEFEIRLSQILRQISKEALFSSMEIYSHIIVDKGKTERQVEFFNTEGEKIIIGQNSSKVLIGLFFRNLNLNMLFSESIPEPKLNFLKEETKSFLNKFFSTNFTIIDHYV